MKYHLLLPLLAFTAISTAGAKSGWEDEFDQGLKKAGETKRLALVDFTGSDWCIWCKRLDEEVFSKPAFKDYVKDKYQLVMVDFPQAKPLPKEQAKANEALAKKYKVQGFPTVLIVDATGKEIGRLGYVEGGPAAFIAELERVTKK